MAAFFILELQKSQHCINNVDFLLSEKSLQKMSTKAGEVHARVATLFYVLR